MSKLSRPLDPGDLTLPEVQHIFRYLGFGGISFRLIPISEVQDGAPRRTGRAAALPGFKDRAEGSIDGLSESALTDEAPQPNQDAIGPDKS